MSKIVTSNISQALQDIHKGKMLIVIDDKNRENEGDLVLSAEKITPKAINFLITYGRGLVCVALTKERLDRLNIPLMVKNNTSFCKTAFTVSADLKHNNFTGISAYDRAETIKKLISPDARPEDFARPGHIFPLQAKEGGVLNRPGHTEAGIDLARLSGCYPASVMCEIISDDGKMARLPQLIEFGRKHQIKIITVKDLIDYRRIRDPIIKQEANITLPTEFGTFKVLIYQNLIDSERYVVFIHGKTNNSQTTLVRIHSECLTGDTFGSLRCDCGKQLKTAFARIAEEGCGILIYASQEGRGIGLINKLKAYALQERGLDTLEANIHLGFGDDLREYSVCAQILLDLGMQKIQLMTNNPDKVASLQLYGINVVKRIPIIITPNGHNKKYLLTKQEKMGHLLDVKKLQNF